MFEIVRDNAELKQLLQKINRFVVNPCEGLPEDLFLYISSIIPLINVDLLIRDKKKGVLLAWRNDEYYGNGWHVPGGIFRITESIEERIQKTAKSEIGCHVSHSDEMLELVPIINRDTAIRKHFFTMVYDCKVPDSYIVDNTGKESDDTGYLKWHKNFPENMIKCHWFYKKYFD